jgi:serine hydrolase
MQTHAASAQAGRAGIAGVGAYPAASSRLLPVSALSRCSILLAPGLHGAVDGDWQRRFPQFRTVGQGDWETPDLDAWARTIAGAALRMSGPVVVVAHGFACLATIQAAALRPGAIAGALLTDPADPACFGLEQRFADLEPDFPSVLVASESDRGLGLARSWLWALRWNSQFASQERDGRGKPRTGAAQWRGQPDLELGLLEQLCRRVAA